MKTQANNKLKFNKQNITELNDNNLLQINGGTSAEGETYSVLHPRPTSKICSAVLANNFEN